jgi:hypothetical protein
MSSTTLAAKPVQSIVEDMQKERERHIEIIRNSQTEVTALETAIAALLTVTPSKALKAGRPSTQSKPLLGKPVKVKAARVPRGELKRKVEQTLQAFATEGVERFTTLDIQEKIRKDDGSSYTAEQISEVLSAKVSSGEVKQVAKRHGRTPGIYAVASAAPKVETPAPSVETPAAAVIETSVAPAQA